MRVASREREAVCLLIDRARVTAASHWSDADVRRYMASVPAELLDELLALRRARASVDEAAAAAREGELAERMRSQRLAGCALVIGELAVDGRDLQATLGIAEGPAIDLILERLLADVIEDPSLYQRVPLLTRAGLIFDELVQGGGGGSERQRME